jgi:hypothetical protein
MCLSFVVSLTTLQLLAPLRVAAVESSQIPDRYMSLGLEAVTGIYDFQYKNFRDGDRQSIIIRSKDQGNFLLVLDRPIHPRSKDIGRLARYIIPGKSHLHISDGKTLFQGMLLPFIDSEIARMKKP